MINAFARSNAAVASLPSFPRSAGAGDSGSALPRYRDLSEQPRTTTHCQSIQRRTNQPWSRCTERRTSRADEYNRQAAEAPILDPWLESQRPNTPQYTDYLSQLDVNPVMATVKVPSADISLPIYHGTETSTLEKGVGHLFGTALPLVAKELTRF